MPFQDTDQTPKRICLGKIVAAHGVKGLVKILPYGDDLSLIEQVEEYKITLKNPLGKYILAEIDGITDRTQAEALKGKNLYIDHDQLPETKDGEHYHADLVGMSVVENDEPIGTVTAIENYGAGDLLDIKLTSGQSILMPFADQYVLDVSDVITVQNHEEMILE